MLISAVLYSILAATKIIWRGLCAWLSSEEILFNPTEDWEHAPSPSIAMTWEGVVRKWLSMVPTQEVWRRYAILPFLIFWCSRSIPLANQNLLFVPIYWFSSSVDVPDATSCKPMSCTDHRSSTWPSSCWASLQVVVPPVKLCLPWSGKPQEIPEAQLPVCLSA